MGALSLAQAVGLVVFCFVGLLWREAFAAAEAMAAEAVAAVAVAVAAVTAVAPVAAVLWLLGLLWLMHAYICVDMK